MKGKYDYKSDRYKSKAGRYYREMLRAKVEKKKLPHPPSLKEGKIIISNKKKKFYGSLSNKKV